MPLVSVIIPAYNASEYLEQCLDSITMQSLDDFEVIIVDDGSTDHTASIAHNYERIDDRFRLIRRENGGVSKARNIGIDNSKGKFITFVDADDALHPKALAAMYAALRDYEAQVCVSAFTRFKKDWRTNGVKVPNHPGKPEIYNYEEAIQTALYQKRLFNSPWGVMIERRLFEDGRRFREGIRYEDLDAFYRFYEGAHKIVYLPFTYYLYRVNPGGFILNWSNSRLDVLDVTDRIEEYFKYRSPSIAKAASDRRFSAHFNMLLLMMKNGVENEDIKQRCLKVIQEKRKGAIIDPNVRLKNKIGAIASYGGKGFLKLLSKIYSGR